MKNKLLLTLTMLAACLTAYGDNSSLRFGVLGSLNEGPMPAFYAGFGTPLSTMPGNAALGLDLAVMGLPSYNDVNNTGTSWAVNYMAGLSIYDANIAHKVKIGLGVGAQFQTQSFACKTSSTGCNNDQNNTLAPYLQIKADYSVNARLSVGLTSIQSTNKNNDKNSSYAGLLLSYLI